MKKTFVSIVANLSPYLAPVPSAYLVARSSIQHLELPLIIGIITGVVIESLGLSSVHTWLLLTNWNSHSRKSDPKAPALYAFILVLLYLVVTIGLTIVLEIVPKMSLYAPAIFPCLALIGAVNIMLIEQQYQREFEVNRVQIERINQRKMNTKNVLEKPKESSSLPNLVYSLDIANEARKLKKEKTLNKIVELLQLTPNISVTELTRITGVKSRTTVYSYLSELQKSGKFKQGYGK
jgi:hypothetical protein